VHVVGVEVPPHVVLRCLRRSGQVVRVADHELRVYARKQGVDRALGLARVERDRDRAELREGMEQDDVVGGGLEQQRYPVATLDARPGHPARRCARLALELGEGQRAVSRHEGGAIGQRLGGAREPVVNSHMWR
jgi:hypothetical protein